MFVLQRRKRDEALKLLASGREVKRLCGLSETAIQNLLVRLYVRLLVRRKPKSLADDRIGQLLGMGLGLANQSLTKLGGF